MSTELNQSTYNLSQYFYLLNQHYRLTKCRSDPKIENLYLIQRFAISILGLESRRLLHKHLNNHILLVNHGNVAVDIITNFKSQHQIMLYPQ